MKSSGVDAAVLGDEARARGLDQANQANGADGADGADALRGALAGPVAEQLHVGRRRGVERREHGLIGAAGQPLERLAEKADRLAAEHGLS